MSLNEFMIAAFVLLAAAVIAAPLATRVGVGSVLGYLIAGVIIGPVGLNLLGHAETIMHFAEFGVIVMLFLVGLELQPSKLWELRKPILGLGMLQVIGTALGLGLAAYLLGSDWRTAIAIGLILALSSTAIVVQSLSERGQMQTAAGRSIFSVLLFQDISVIPMFALLPLLAVAAAHGDGHETASLVADLPAWAQTIAVLAAVALIIVAGRHLMRPAFRFVAASGTREIFVAFALLIVIAITLLMGLVGMSAALGTFLGGVVLAESEYRHELEMDLDPFKGLLLALFFMAVGAGINFGLIMQEPLRLLGYVLVFILIKAVILYAVARLFRMTAADSAGFSLNLAQGGEFAFVLISFCLGLGILAAGDGAMLTVIVALSMAIAPLLMLANDKWVQPFYSRAGVQRGADAIDEQSPVVIAGHGRFGMTVGRILSARGFKPVVLDHDAEQIDALRRLGFTLFYGDASRLDLLEAAGCATAKVLVIAVDGREKINVIAETAKRHFPHLRIFARAFDRVHAYELINLGVDDVYREVYSSSTDMAEHVLASLGVHPYEARRASQQFRTFDARMLRKQARLAGDQEAMFDMARRSRAELSRILSGDQQEAPIRDDEAWHDDDRPKES
jgi:monovalent cation:proton antiporter-2 (CPA2) family protein